MNLKTLVATSSGTFRPALVGVLSFLLANPAALSAQSPTISAANWGTVTAPVYGSSEAGVYSQAELFAGPRKFGSYFSGVLPSGAIVRPAGASIQIGMNPLGVALSPDGKFLVGRTTTSEMSVIRPSKIPLTWAAILSRSLILARLPSFLKSPLVRSTSVYK